MRRVPRESKGIAGLTAFLILAWLVLGCGGVAWEMSTAEMWDVEGFLSDLDYEALSNSGLGLCPICRELEKLAAELMEAQTPDEQGSIIRTMLNVLWEHPDWQRELRTVIIQGKGDAWFSMWVGVAYVVDVAGRRVTIVGITGLPSYCQAWCDSVPCELWNEIPPPPACFCGAKEMM